MKMIKWTKVVRFCCLMILSFSLIMFFGCGGSGGDGGNDNTDGPGTGDQHTHLGGSLSLRITNKIPPFDETTKVDVDISKTGKVTFGSGTLTFDSEAPLGGGGKIRRTGTYILNPKGVLTTCNGEECLSVNENTSFTDRSQVWAGGKKVADETRSGTWDGGLVFNIMDSQVDGSVIQAQSEAGSVTWTLLLFPALTKYE